MKRSIKKQITATFIIVITCTVVLCVLANFLFLKGYYVINKKNSITDIHILLIEASQNNLYSSDKFTEFLSISCNKGNISITVIDENNNPLLKIGYASDFLENYMLNSDNKEINFNSFSSSEYKLDTIKANNREYLSMWGKLNNNEKFAIICPIESVEDSVAIANTFLLHIGILSILAGIIATIVISRRITKPIVEICNISSKMANLDFSTKYTSINENEMDVLGENINFMSEKLENTICELKSANSSLIKDIKQKEEIEDMRKEFTSNVSHELKTPISLIQSYAEGLKEGIFEDEESKDYYLDVIIDESNKMNNLVRQLMSLSEVEYGKDELTIERVDIAELIKNHLMLNELLFKQNNIEMIYENSDEHIYVWTDVYRCEQVIRNYLSNAIHYCEGEKKIIIKIDKLGQLARINVFNTGKNIDCKDLPHIWEKFYKADKARSREYGGSGVGLSLIKAIMDSFNMKYGVENMPDGVNFYFELPFN